MSVDSYMPFTVVPTPKQVYHLGMNIRDGVNVKPDNLLPNYQVDPRHFRNSYGLDPHKVSDLMSKLMWPKKTKPGHVLWGLLFLRIYPRDDQIKCLVGVSLNTFRKWVWKVVETIAYAIRGLVSLL